MSNAKVVDAWKPPGLGFRPVIKNRKHLLELRPEVGFVERKLQKWSYYIPKSYGLSPRLLGTIVFRYIVLKDSDGLWPLPVFLPGPVFGYIAPRNRKINIDNRYLCHTSHEFAWLYDDYGNIKKFKADVIKFYYSDNYAGFVIERFDSNENAKEDTYGREIKVHD